MNILPAGFSQELKVVFPKAKTMASQQSRKNF
jgi:hypothetical protein